jgi:tRNA/tmRNA/rRNA uracil-C5-methylase (TrmA/RlmC/RlmD family)
VAAVPADHQRLVVVTPGPKWAGPNGIPAVDAAVALAPKDHGRPTRGGPDAAAGLARVRGRTWLRERVVVGEWEHEFRVTGGGFWQVHPAAAATLVQTVLDQLRPARGERALDLYSGVGLFAAALGDRVGPSGAVVAVEADARAVADARRNLHDLPQVQLRQGAVGRALAAALSDLPGGATDLVVLDPPRAGAGRQVVETICAAGPRAICYVACDPAALARDLATAADRGYRLAALRAFDAFPMTHHVECVALLTPAGGRPAAAVG